MSRDAASDRRRSSVHTSVLICTRNRASSLATTLDTLLSAENVARPDWELVVVDNGSEDDTRAVCLRFTGALGERFRYVYEPRPGLSIARNTAVDSARGDLLAWIDDDVICSAGYLEAVRDTFTDPTVDAAQGRILLDCQGGVPAWVGPECLAMLSLRDHGETTTVWRDNLSGCNMVMRASLLRRFGGFTLVLGAGAAGYMEDSELSMRLREAGCRIVYSPSVLVQHRIRADRLSRSFFRRSFFLFGRSSAYLRQLDVPLWRYALYVASRLPRDELVAAWLWARGRPAEALRLQCLSRKRLGFLWQHLRFRRGAGQPLPHGPAATRARSAT